MVSLFALHKKESSKSPSPELRSRLSPLCTIAFVLGPLLATTVGVCVQCRSVDCEIKSLFLVAPSPPSQNPDLTNSPESSSNYRIELCDDLSPKP